MSLNRLIQRGIIHSEGDKRLPQVIQLSELSKREVTTAIQQIKSHGNSPLPENLDQLNLFQ